MNREVFLKMNFKMLLVILLINLLSSCSQGSNQEKTNKNNDSALHYKNLNLTILLDLSDRISNKKNPDQYKKDIIFINNVLDAFKSYLNKKGVVESEDKIKLIFYPVSMDDLYQEVADSLSVDFSKLEFVDRKKTYENISAIYNRQLQKLYSIASNAKIYTGSDLFNYFKHRIVDDCISTASNYTNLLVILTDGYIYEKNSMYQEGNKFSYLVPEAQHVKIFRKLSKWEEHFEKNNYGLIPLENDLSSLNVLIGEIHPIENSPKDFDILKKYWSDWLESQKVKKFKIIKTDINTLNRDIIFNFINQLTSN